MARKAKQPKGKRMNPTFFVFCEGKTEAAYVDVPSDLSYSQICFATKI